MSDNPVEITIPVDGREALIAHIQELERVISKRNQEIKNLEIERDALRTENEKLISEPFEFIERVRSEGFRNGWETCSKTVSAYLDKTREAITIREES